MFDCLARPQAVAQGPQAVVQRDRPAAPVRSLKRGPGRWSRTHERSRKRDAARVPAAGGGAGAAAAGRPGDEFFATDRRPIILFDGVCNMCNGGVQFMLAWDREEPGRFRFAALQSAAGRALLRRSGRSPDDISSIVLVEPGASHIKSAAILRIAAGLQAPLPLVSAALDFTFPRVFKDAVYDQIANNRYLLFGRTSECRLSDPRYEERFVA